jgi:hypothetical protein
MKYFDILKPNIDSFGVITQNANDSWDGGDTSQREGMYMLAMDIHFLAGRITTREFADTVNRYDGIVDQLNFDNGWSLRRHPDPSKWYHDPNRMSRDQLVPNIVCIGAHNRSLLVKMILKNYLRLGLFSTNTRENGSYKTDNPPMGLWQKIQYAVGLYNPGIPSYAWKLPDIMDPSIWGAYIRGLNWKVLWPVLLVTDLMLLGGALLTYYKTKKGTASNDQNTQQMLLLQSHFIMTTPASWLAMRIYKRTNPMGALNSYFAPSTNGPAMNLIYEEIWADIK